MPMACARRKHVLVEKPMALTLDECRAMIEAAREAGVTADGRAQPQLRRADPPRGKADRERRLWRAAHDHRARLHRLPLSPAAARRSSPPAGGGAVFNQAAHQVDIARLLAGGKVRSVRAFTGIWDPSARPKAPIRACSASTTACSRAWSTAATRISTRTSSWAGSARWGRRRIPPAMARRGER